MSTELARRLTWSLVVTLGLGGATVAAWLYLERHEQRLGARLIQTESAAATNNIERRHSDLYASLAEMRDRWAAQPRVSREEWTADALFLAGRLRGLERIALWRGAEDSWWWPEARGDADFGVGRGPAPAGLHDALRRADGDIFDYQPVYGDAGSDENYRLVALLPSGPEGGLVAIIDLASRLETLLATESPGHTMRIYHDGHLVYARGSVPETLPDGWLQTHSISMGPDFDLTIEHAPTAETAALLLPPATDLILLLGLVIAVLMGTLTYENSRARSRALRAERAERKLDWMNRELEELVGERTRELNIRTVDLRTVSDSVAHDLRNPLNAIAANAELVRYQFQDTLDARGRAALERIPGSIQQITEILDRLLGLSMLSHSAFERETVELRPFVRSLFNDLIVAEPPPPVDLELDELPAVEADPLLLRLLLQNLLSNAIKYTRGQPVRKVRVSHESRGGVDVFCVSDTGIGFDQEAAQRLFQAFHRLRNQESAEGFGLGLTIAARAVHRHGGRIWASGEKGAGAKFYFSLEPLADVRECGDFGIEASPEASQSFRPYPA